jgi:glyoxylase-like metal-dependent hydrolase (beta-lactamase superfamily II)
MTGPGTNTYLLGTATLAVIDPGPDSDTHLAALLRIIGDRTVSHIIVTHSHLDHSPLAKPLSEHTQAPVYAFGDTFAGRSPVMAGLAADGMAGGGEGLDLGFRPDITVTDNETIHGADWTLRVMHTPGHLGNHIALVWEDAVFVGDLVMGWSTSLVSPPDGDMDDFLRSCRRLADLPATVHYAGHGAPILDPQARLSDLIAHRDARTAAILLALTEGRANVADLVSRIYVGLDPALAGAAGRNVFAHLVALETKGQVTADPRLHPDATFALLDP